MSTVSLCLALLLAVSVALVSAAPAAHEVLPGQLMLVQEEPEGAAPHTAEFDLTEAVGHVEERGDRHRRVTCDLLSVSVPWGSLNHAACAAHCLGMRKGYRGGRCINGVCNCRR